MARKERERGEDKNGRRHEAGTAAASCPTTSSATRADNGASEERRRSRSRSRGKKAFSSKSPESRNEAPGREAGTEHQDAAADEEGELKRGETDGKQEEAAATNTQPPPLLGSEREATVAANLALSSNGDKGNNSTGSVTDVNMPTTGPNRSTITVIIVSVALFLFVAILARNSQLHSARAEKLHEEQYSLCKTSACLEYSQQLQRSLNARANPCYNFYRYVCDSLRDRYPHESVSSLSVAGVRFKTRILRSWIDDGEGRRRDGERSLRAASLLRSCFSAKGLRDGPGSPVFELRDLMSARGLRWPDVPPPNTPVDILGVLVDWTLNWNIDVLFSLRVALVDRTLRKFAFQLSHSAALQRWIRKRADFKTKDQYELFVARHVEEFGASNTVNHSVAEVVEAEPEVQELFAYPANEAVLASEDPAKDQKLSTAHWRRTIHRKLGSSAYNVSEDDIVPIAKQSLLQAVAILLSRHAKQVKYYSVIGWSVARELGLLVSASLRALHGVTGTELLLWCFDRMDALTSGALVEPIFMSTLLRKALVPARELFRELRESVSVALTDNSWMDNRTREIASSKMAAVSLAIGYSNGLTPRVLHTVQPPRRSGNKALFGAWKEATIAYQALPLETKASLHPYDPLSPNAFYRGEAAEVRLQPALLEIPAYADGLPESLRYAGLGSVLMHQMMHALDDVFPLLEEQPRSPALLNHPSFQEYSRRVRCLRRFRNETALQLGESRSRYNFSDWFCDFAGVARLHNVVFGPRAKPHRRGERLPGFEDLSAEQLFFVGICHTLCTSSGQSLAESRCNVPLMHMPQFARAFQCPAGSPMTPNTRCSFW